MITNLLAFSSNGSNHIATTRDIFMDNGTAIVYIREGKYSNPNENRVHIGDKEWQRIKHQLTPVDYEEYYGRKPIMKGVKIYKIKAPQ